MHYLYHIPRVFPEDVTDQTLAQNFRTELLQFIKKTLRQSVKAVAGRMRNCSYPQLARLTSTKTNQPAQDDGTPTELPLYFYLDLAQALHVPVEFLTAIRWNRLFVDDRTPLGLDFVNTFTIGDVRDELDMRENKPPKPFDEKMMRRRFVSFIDRHRQIQAKFADDLGMSVTTLQRFLACESKGFRPEHIERIAASFGMYIRTVLSERFGYCDVGHDCLVPRKFTGQPDLNYIHLVTQTLQDHFPGDLAFGINHIKRVVA